MRRAVIAFTAAALAAAALPVAAQTPADKSDARCILVLNLVGMQAGKDVTKRAQASEGVFYYLGRLSARGASGKLGGLLVSEAGAITTQQQAQAELARCGNELTARVGDLRNGLTTLQNAGRAKAAAAGPAAAPAPAPAAVPAPK